MTFEEIKEAIFEAGVIGAGGAGFPTHIKLAAQMDYLVINGAECEPLIYTDYQLMEHYGEEMVIVIRQLLQALCIKKAVWGIKKKHSSLIAKLRTMTSSDENIEICALDNIYPAGDELTLIHHCTGIIIPRGQLPSSKKVIELNVETIWNLYKALFEKLPVTEKYVMIGGAVEEPMVFKVPLGTPYKELIKQVKPQIEDYELLIGGPMMGSFASKEGYVTKTTKALLILPKESKVYCNKEALDLNRMKRVMSCCSQCQMCTDLCPRNKLGHQVEPHKVMNAFANGLLNHGGALRTALGCCGCNICSYYACHHDLMPSQFMMLIKKELLKQGIKPEANEPLVTNTGVEVEIPSSRLLDKLGIKQYDKHPLWVEEALEVQKVYLPLAAHLGNPSMPLVQVGEKVNKGQLIACGSKKKISCQIHSSLEGLVSRMTETEIVIERRVVK